MTPSRSSTWFGWLSLGCVLAAVLAACLERAPARFPHKTHLAAMACGSPGQPDCLSCTSCHRIGKDGDPPRGETALCANCHTKDAARLTSALVVKPDPHSSQIAFNHAGHLALSEVRGQCVACHGGVVTHGSAMPSMQQCFGCHEHAQQWANAQCTPCHTFNDLSRTLPRTFLRHDAAFLRSHGALAVQSKALCQSCHSQAQCNDCHDISQELTLERRRPEQVMRTRVHEGDVMVRHALEARSDPSRCVRCHTPETCESCHFERGVSANRLGSINPHPPGWIGSNANASSLHGREARRDLVACAACHEQGPLTNCIRCHKVGAYGGNPHPNGWHSGQSTSQGMCRYCHE